LKCEIRRQKYRSYKECHDLIVNSNLKLALKIASILHRAGGTMTFLDAVQEGNIGLEKAVEKYLLLFAVSCCGDVPWHFGFPLGKISPSWCLPRHFCFVWCRIVLHANYSANLRGYGRIGAGNGENRRII